MISNVLVRKLYGITYSYMQANGYYRQNKWNFEKKKKVLP